MLQAKVSIIVPVYNVEKYIEKCVNSICQQDYENLQVILIDDGSKDNSGRICDKFSEIDSRIVVLHQNNSGVSVARNNGLDVAEGKYIGFVDSDDYLEKDYISTLVQEMEKYDLSICGFYEDIDDNIIIRTSGNKRQLGQREAMTVLFKENGYRGYLWNKLFVRDIIEQDKLRFDIEISVWEDVLFVFEYLCKCKNVYYNPFPKYHYVYREGSASHGENVIKKTYSAIIAKNIISDKIPAEYQDVRDELNIRYVTSALSVLRLCAFERRNSDVSWYENEAAKIIKLYAKYCKGRLTKQDSLSVLLCKINPVLFQKFYWLKNR